MFSLDVSVLFVFLHLKANDNFQLDVYENGYPPRD